MGVEFINCLYLSMSHSSFIMTFRLRYLHSLR